MFQIQGGIFDGAKERLFSKLQKQGHIVVANGRVCTCNKGMIGTGLLFAD